MYKKSTLFLCLFGLYTLSFGQIQYGIKMGMSQSTTHWTLRGAKEDIDFKTCLQLGAFAGIPLAKHLQLRPALQLTQKGYRAETGNQQGPYYWERNVSTSYLEIPIDLLYDLWLSEKLKFFVGAGPVISVGLFGKINAVLKITDSNGQLVTNESSGDSPFKNPGYKRMDMGVGFLSGLQYGRMMVMADYNHGLSNVLNYDKGIQTAKNRSFAFTLGYLIRQ